MKKIIPLFLLVLVQLVYSSDSVRTQYGKFYDAERKRDVPYKVYYKENLTGKSPVIIFSHGLGGSVEAGQYLGEHLARNGYICFHIQHIGSDESVWEGVRSQKEAIEKLKESLKDYKNAVNRFKDIPFVIDEIIKLNKTSETFKEHIDTNNIGIIGHSYGARTVLITAGEKVLKGTMSFKEPRLKVGVALSPNFSENPPDDIRKLYEDIDIPIFHITGTEDGDPLNRDKNFSPEDRTKPYKNITTSPQYLLVLYKAVHSTFNGGERATKEDPYLEEHLEDIKTGVTAFLNYYLKGSEENGNWLKNQFKKELDKNDRFEWKE
ncbi:MAG: dienelactone hydrolase family protein [Ignavibacteria bacterium]|nr:dienelactone hydrolase family protein [Ignavibacteria bacterium]